MTGSYTLNHHNSYRYTDPDGREPVFNRLLGLWFMEKSDPAPALLLDTAPDQRRLGVEDEEPDYVDQGIPPDSYESDRYETNSDESLFSGYGGDDESASSGYNSRSDGDSSSSGGER